MFKQPNIIGDSLYFILERISAFLIPIGAILLFFGIIGYIVKIINEYMFILCVVGLLIFLIGLIIEKWKDYNG